MSATHSIPHTVRPAVDEHIVMEGSRAEILDGELLLTPPAQEPHGTKHFDLAYLLGAHVAPGYLGAVDLLVRAAEDQDFAPDASIFPAERDPQTGGRQLDVLAFEIVGEQPLSVCTRKARALSLRGVRRVFCIVLHSSEVLEWYPPTDSWARLEGDARIRDVCLVHPLPVAALLHAAVVDEAVIDALRARKSEALAALERHSFRQGCLEGHTAGHTEGHREGHREGHFEGRAEGRLEARRQSVLDLCEVLSIPLEEERRQQLAGMGLAEIEALLSVLKSRKRWM